MNDLIIEWSPNVKAISMVPIAIHWYSLMFLLAFYFGFRIMKKIYIKENKDIALLDPFLVHMVVGTIVGARLGEVFFYNWGYFQNNLNLWDIAAGIVLVKEAGGVINEINLSIYKNIKIS